MLIEIGENLCGALVAFAFAYAIGRIAQALFIRKIGR